MKYRMMSLALAALLLAPVSRVTAGALKADSLPSGTSWVAHLDVEQLTRTRLGNLLLEQMAQGEAGRKLDAFAVMFGFDPRRDVAGLTAFGRDRDERNHVVVLQARLDRPRIETLLRAGDGYETHSRGDRVVHSWVDPKKAPSRRMYGLFTGDDVVMVGQDEDAVVAAASAREGKGARLAPEAELHSLLQSPAVPVMLAVADFRAMPSASRAAALRQATSGIFTVDERERRVDLKLNLTAVDAESALQLRDLAQGMLALAALKGAEQPEIAAFARAVSVTAAGRGVSAVVSYPVENLAALLQKQAGSKGVPDAKPPARQP